METNIKFEHLFFLFARLRFRGKGRGEYRVAKLKHGLVLSDFNSQSVDYRSGFRCERTQDIGDEAILFRSLRFHYETSGEN